jgi:hypothetical protein
MHRLYCLYRLYPQARMVKQCKDNIEAIILLEYRESMVDQGLDRPGMWEAEEIGRTGNRAKAVIGRGSTAATIATARPITATTQTQIPSELQLFSDYSPDCSTELGWDPLGSRWDLPHTVWQSRIAQGDGRG